MRKYNHGNCNGITTTKTSESCGGTSFEIFEGKMECNVINGMHLVSEYKRESFVTTIGCLLPAGTMFEKPDERGSALFLEHLLFQVNTKQYKENVYLTNSIFIKNITRIFICNI